MDYTKWAGAEPNDWGSGEDCGGYYSGHSHGLWNDQPCGWKIPYVCGYRGSAEPEPVKAPAVAFTFHEENKTFDEARADC